MTNSDEFLPFRDDSERSPALPVGAGGQRWRVLIVDDDPDVHETTQFALGGMVIQGRRLALLHAYSGKETLALLRRETDIAVILLDVVMETEATGLHTVKAIREELGLIHTRIILCTGQPGHAPETETIHRYDINDYKTKNELVRSKLYAMLTTAIRSYDQLQQLDASRRGLERIVAASNQLIAEQGLYTFAEGVIIQIAGFAGVEPEGMVCCAAVDPRGVGDGQIHYVVIAAAGRYRSLIQRRLEEINDARIVDHLSRCLTKRCNVINERSLTLFFPGREGHDFAAFIDSPAPLPEVDQHLLQVFCVNIALCADNVALVSCLRDYAFVDRLVGLPNRTAFINTIDQRLQDEGDHGLTIALIDVDQFAEINDMLGHRYGDLLLLAIARRLEQPPLDQCRIARVAGDTFGIFGEDRLIRPDILRPVFAAPFKIEDVEHPVSVSMGFVRLREYSGHGAELVKDASIALKHAKSSGLGQVAYYSDTVRNETRERTRLLHDLHHAFDHRHLFVVYQPQVSLSSQAVVGVEALLRWRTEDGVFIPPDRFIPVAEQSGLIVSLGNWVLRTALYALTRLRAAGHSGVRMAVNVSAVQLRQPQFLQTVDAALCDTGTRPEDLELEITESVSALGFDYVKNLLHQFKENGLAIAIDDFGTGFSSLSYLDRLPADRLKIDRTFVWALESHKPGARIAEIVIALGHKLGMKVLAEGVENATQVALLQELECDDAQGYYFAKPMPLDELLNWMHAWRGERR